MIPEGPTLNQVLARKRTAGKGGGKGGEGGEGGSDAGQPGGGGGDDEDTLSRLGASLEPFAGRSYIIDLVGAPGGCLATGGGVESGPRRALVPLAVRVAKVSHV